MMVMMVVMVIINRFTFTTQSCFVFDPNLSLTCTVTIN